MHSRHFLLALPVCLGIACSSGVGANLSGSEGATASSSSGITGLLTTTSATTSSGTDTGTTAEAPPTTSGSSSSGAGVTGDGAETSGGVATTGEGPTTDAPPPGLPDTTLTSTSGGEATTEERPGEKPQPVPPPENAPDPGLLVALMGDQGTGSDTKAVYKLILEEQADLVIILGDFDYGDDPDAWASEMEDVLGDSFPVFGVIGNHDTDAWPGYQEQLEKRLAKIEGASCEGDLGVKSSCKYRGLHFILSGLGTKGSDSDHEKHIAETLAADDSLWSLCAWHKNQRDLQAGDKPDDLTWKAVQTCQDNGAIVVMGHEHSYARTMTLTDVGNKGAGHGAVGIPELMEIGPGRTFSVCSGLGGKSIREYDSSLHNSDTWWSTIYTKNHYRKNGAVIDDFEADHGVLFMRFHVDGDPSLGHGYFKNIQGEMIDEFDLVHK